MPAELRVATFNIRNGRAFDGWDSWPFRRRTTSAAVGGLGADVVCLQEVYRFQLRGLLRRLPRYEAVGRGRGRRGRGEHCPVLYDAGRLTLESSDTWALGTRIATVARFRFDGGGLHVVSTHFPTGDPGARSAAAATLASLLDLAVANVVAGDFNAAPDAPELRPLLDIGLRHALEAPDDVGTYHRFSGTRRGRRIDHVLVDRRLTVLAAEIAHPRPRSRLPSDHWPVVADLSVAPAAPPSGSS